MQEYLPACPLLTASGVIDTGFKEVQVFEWHIMFALGKATVHYIDHVIDSNARLTDVGGEDLVPVGGRGRIK